MTFTTIARTPGWSQHNLNDKLSELNEIKKYQYKSMETMQSKTKT